MTWEIVIGLETHAQLRTRSKMFSGASTEFGAEPNVQASAVDIALPGVLPVANQGAIELAIRFGLAVNGEISRRSVFARKNYFYPDLPKGYQISQYEIPVVKGGTVHFFLDKEEKSVRLTRAHLEEDAGKSLHELPGSHAVLGHGMSGIDLNRAGTPLLEIVSEPELRSAREATAYAKALHSLVRWIDICDGNMQEGSFRCDANVSVRKEGDTKLGTRCEIKNLNSFRFMEKAIEFEARRQIELLEDGGRVVQETRLYDADKDETRPMRSKEDAQDYRYFPDPDLLPLVLTEEIVESVRENLERQYGPLPEKWRQDLIGEYKLSPTDAGALTSDDSRIPHVFKAAAREALISGEPSPTSDASKLSANWVINEYMPRFSQDREDFPKVAIPEGVSGKTIGYLIRQIRTRRINANTARKLFEEFWTKARENRFEQHGGTYADVDQAIEARGLAQISDSAAIEKLVDEVLAANEKQVADYRAGKEKAFNSLVGQVMKKSAGKANPAQVNEVLKKKLAG